MAPPRQAFFIGFRSAYSWDIFLSGKNLLDEEYFELRAAQP